MIEQMIVLITSKLTMSQVFTKSLVNTLSNFLIKNLDEILVNAADNYQNDKSMNLIKVDIDPDRNMIQVWNNGKGIPV